MTAIDDHGRVSSEAEQELAGQPICQRDRGTNTELQGTYGSAGATSYSDAGASNLYLSQVNCRYNENYSQLCPDQKAWLRGRFEAIGQE